MRSACRRRSLWRDLERSLTSRMAISTPATSILPDTTPPLVTTEPPSSVRRHVPPKSATVSHARCSGGSVSGGSGLIISTTKRTRVLTSAVSSPMCTRAQTAWCTVSLSDVYEGIGGSASAGSVKETCRPSELINICSARLDRSSIAVLVTDASSTSFGSAPAVAHVITTADTEVQRPATAADPLISNVPVIGSPCMMRGSSFPSGSPAASARCIVAMSQTRGRSGPSTSSPDTVFASSGGESSSTLLPSPQQQRSASEQRVFDHYSLLASVRPFRQAVPPEPVGCDIKRGSAVAPQQKRERDLPVRRF